MKENVFTVVISWMAALLLFVGCSVEKSTKDRPNILFCLADDVTYQHMGAYGCQWVKTPSFDRVASEGILFTNAFTPNAKCAPSRSAILTGRNSWQLKEAANHFPFFPSEFKSYPEVLMANGYYVGSTGKKWSPGDPGMIDGKKRELCGPEWDKHKLDPLTSGISPIDYAHNFEDFLDSKPDGTPFCFWYGCLEPHRGYEFRSGIEKGGKSLDMVDDVPDFWPDNEAVRTDMLDYALEIEHFDDHLGQMLAALEKRGMLENTIVVVTADNGMPFPRAKGQEYNFSNHLPLAIMWKNGLKNPGRVVTDYVSFIDLAPTFLELAGVSHDSSGMKKIEGKSLTDILYSEKVGSVNPERNSVLIGKERHDVGRPNDEGYPIRGIVKENFLYVHNFETDRWPAGNPESGYPNVDGSPTKTEVIQSGKSSDTHHFWELSFGKRQSDELYNLAEDPQCMNNLAGLPEFQGKMQSLHDEMFERLKEQGDPRMFGEGHIFDEYKYSGKDSNYYNRMMNGEDIKLSWINQTDIDPQAE